MTVQRAALYQWSLLGDHRLCWRAIGSGGARMDLVDSRLQGVKCGTRYLGLIALKRDVMICKPNDFMRYRSPDKNDLLVMTYNSRISVRSSSTHKYTKNRKNNFAMRPKVDCMLVTICAYLIVISFSS